MSTTTTSSQRNDWSIASVRAIERLNSIKPNDGWSIDVKLTSTVGGSTQLVRLLRRNVPVTDTFFLDIHYDPPSGTVVGILTPPKQRQSSGSASEQQEGTVQAQVLVNSNGTLANNQQKNQRISIVSIHTYSSNLSSKERSTTSNTNNTNNVTSIPGFGTTTISDAEKQQMMLYFGYAIVGAIVLRILATAAIGVLIILIPFGLIYLTQTCPPIHSFDVKQQLKRVLRGQHLPENHPSKPKGFLSETFARVTASVATELATLPGYEVTTTDIIGTAILIKVRVPTANLDFFWLGAIQQWYFLYSKEIDTTTSTGTPTTHFSSTGSTQFRR
jgi:hypothetical protein